MFAVYGAISAGGTANGLILGGTLTEFATWPLLVLVNAGRNDNTTQPGAPAGGDAV